MSAAFTSTTKFTQLHMPFKAHAIQGPQMTAEYTQLHCTEITQLLLKLLNCCWNHSTTVYYHCHYYCSSLSLNHRKSQLKLRSQISDSSLSWIIFTGPVETVARLSNSNVNALQQLVLYSIFSLLLTNESPHFWRSLGCQSRNATSRENPHVSLH